MYHLGDREVTDMIVANSGSGRKGSWNIRCRPYRTLGCAARIKISSSLWQGQGPSFPEQIASAPDLTAAATVFTMAAQTINVSICPTAARASRPVRARAAAQPARLTGYTGLSKHNLGVAPSECLRTIVASRVAAPASRGQRIVATMAKKSVGDLTKADLEGKRVLVSTCSQQAAQRNIEITRFRIRFLSFCIVCMELSGQSV